MRLQFFSPRAALMGAAAAMGAVAVQAAPAKIASATVTPHLIYGDLVSVEDQRLHGLVKIYNGGGYCSGTLLNRFWVLTAAHCIEDINSPSDMQITAAWSANPTALGTRIVHLSSWQSSDVALIYLGSGDLGPTIEQPIYAPQVGITTSVRKYGVGLYKYATAGPPQSQALFDDNYRSGSFDAIPEFYFSYRLNANSKGQVGAAGDSGGPDWVVENGRELGISGVSSVASASYLEGKPADWIWVTGVNWVRSAALSPIRDEILAVINAPPCPNVADACGVAESTSLLIH